MTWGFVRFSVRGRGLGHKWGCVPFLVWVAGEDPSDIEGAPSPIASPLRSRRYRAPSPASYGFLPPLPSRFPAFRLVKVTQGSTDSPATLNRYTATSPKLLVTCRDTVRTVLVNTTNEVETRETLGEKLLESSGN